MSRKVAELEDALRVRLLNSTTRRVSLIDNGRQFFESCRRILDELSEAERAVTGEYHAPRGELVLTAPIVFGRLHIVPIVPEFLAAFTEVDVRLQLVDRMVNLIDENADVALRIGELSDSAMVAIRLGVTRPVVCASPAYLAGRGVPDRPEALARHACISFTGLAAASQWPFRAGRMRQTVQVHPRLVVTTAEAAIDAAIAGVGITRVLSYQVAQALKEGRLSIVLADFELEPLPVSLVHLSGRLIPAKLRSFLDFAAARLRSQLESLG